jgi:hypothetical protein
MKTKILRSYVLTLLLSYALTVLNAQVDENIILDSISIQKNELILTPEIEEKLVFSLHRDLNNLSDESLLSFRITNRSQLENLHIGKTIPEYRIDLDKENLIFTDSWEAIVMHDGEPLFTISVGKPEYERRYYSWRSSGRREWTQNIHNYEHKNLIIGSLRVSPPSMYFLIIKKEHQDIFVEVNDETTGESIKNEYSFNELINYKKENAKKMKEARNRYYDEIANKSELIITPEITEMVVNNIYSWLIDADEEKLSNYGIKNKAQLEHLQLEKPIPMYFIDFDNENLRFKGCWQVPVVSEGKPHFCAEIVLKEEDGQYSIRGVGRVKLAKNISNYEYKDLIIGYLDYTWICCLIIRKDNKDIFVKVDDYDKREYFKSEYSFSELINLFKK